MMKVAALILVTLSLALAANINGPKKDTVIDPSVPLEWWQTGVIYQVYPRSFKDSDGDGIGDLKGIEQKAAHFADLGVAAVWLSPIYKSPMADFGYDISNFVDIADEYGTMDDFHSLKDKLHSLGIKLVMDFVPNHSSDEHEWFKKSVKRIDPYTNYYVWKEPVWNGSVPNPPNNWLSVFSGSAWEYNKERKQYYLHQFAVKQPDLNYRCKELVQEIKNALKFWMEQGVDGFRVDAVPFLFEDARFLDEPKNEDFIPHGGADLKLYSELDHIYTNDQPETYDMVEQLKEVVHEFSKSDNKQRMMVVEAYTTINNTMKYYGNGEFSAMPFNFLLITTLNAQKHAIAFSESIHEWMDLMPKGKWANWVIGNHDNSRVATRYGPELADGMNMINLLLPGTAFTYNGEEIAMTDAFIRWDQTVDPSGRNVGPNLYDKYSRDPERTPYQWDNSMNAGFSSSHQTWLPVNPNYWRTNLALQKSVERSHYKVYKRLVQLRSEPVIQRGGFLVQALSNWTLAISRSLPDSDDLFLIIVNLGTEEDLVNLQEIMDVPDTMIAHTVSVNALQNIGDVVSVFGLRAKSSLVLTTLNKKSDLPSETIDTTEAAHLSSADSRIILCWLISFLFLCTIYQFISFS